MFTAMKAAILIQRWYRQYLARIEIRRRYTWNIFQTIEYAGEQDQMKVSELFTSDILLLLDSDWIVRKFNYWITFFFVLQLYNFFHALLTHIPPKPSIDICAKGSANETVSSSSLSTSPSKCSQYWLLLPIVFPPVWLFRLNAS